MRMKQVVDCLWVNTNIANKSLVLLGMIALLDTIVTFFWKNNSVGTDNVVVLSVMSNVFGYIFGSQVTSKRNIRSMENQTWLAGGVSLTCLLVIIAAHWSSISQTEAAAVELRNLLFASVGFLISRAKNHQPEERC